MQAVRDLFPRGVDHVFDFVGARPVTAQGLQMLGTGGGLPDRHHGREPWHRGGRTRALETSSESKGVYMGSSNLKRDIPFYPEMSLQGRFNLRDLVSKEVGLGAIDDGYEALKDGSIARVVITDFTT